MIDFNSSASISGQLEALIDAGMQSKREVQTPRDYLGASRLGSACERALQYEFAKAPAGSRTDSSGRILRIFERGHLTEDCMVTWLRDAGFDLRTRKADGEQFGFAAVDGRLRGHIDGVIVAGPDGLPTRRCGSASAWDPSPGATCKRTRWPWPSRSTTPR